MLHSDEEQRNSLRFSISITKTIDLTSVMYGSRVKKLMICVRPKNDSPPYPKMLIIDYPHFRMENSTAKQMGEVQIADFRCAWSWQRKQVTLPHNT